MAMICCICGKKQSGFIMDYPLSEDLVSLRICATCYEKKESMIKNAEFNQEEFIQYRQYFIDIIQNKKTSSEVSKYIEEIICLCNNKVEIIKQRELEKLQEIEQRELMERNHKNLIENFLMTTGFNFEGYKITCYNKVICAETVLGTGFLSEFTANLADFFGVESQRFASKLEEARNIAIQKLIDKAIDLNANAIIGIDFDYTLFGGNIIGVIVNGTAVTVEKNSNIA